VGSIFHALSAGRVALQPDGSLLIQSAPSRYVASTVIFLLVAGVCLILWRKDIAKRFAVIFLCASLVVPLIVLPGFAVDSVRLTPEQLWVQTGFWFAPTRHKYPLEGLVGIHEHMKSGHRAGEEQLFWTFYWKDGRSEDLDLPDLFEVNRQAAVAYLAERGVKVFTSVKVQ
jgi:hypothetical protein